MSGPTTTPPAPQAPRSGWAGISDWRSWAALAVLAAVAVLTGIRWRWLGWCWGILLAVLLLRAGAYILRARAAGKDPEEALAHRKSKQPPPAPER